MEQLPCQVLDLVTLGLDGCYNGLIIEFVVCEFLCLQFLTDSCRLFLHLHLYFGKARVDCILDCLLNLLFPFLDSLCQLLFLLLVLLLGFRHLLLHRIASIRARLLSLLFCFFFRFLGSLSLPLSLLSSNVNGTGLRWARCGSHDHNCRRSCCRRRYRCCYRRGCRRHRLRDFFGGTESCSIGVQELHSKIH